MNKLYPSAKLSEIATRRIVRGFAENLPVGKISKRAGLTDRQIINVINRLRLRLQPHFVDLEKQHQDTIAWKTFTAELIRQTALIATARYSGAFREVDAYTLAYSTKPSAEKAAELMTAISESPKEFQAHLTRASQAEFAALKNKYKRTFLELRRGSALKEKTLFDMEFSYRFTTFILSIDGSLASVSQKLRRFSTNDAVLQFDKSLYRRVFASNRMQADLIETDILGVLGKTPL